MADDTATTPNETGGPLSDAPGTTRTTLASTPTSKSVASHNAPPSTSTSATHAISTSASKPPVTHTTSNSTPTSTTTPHSTVSTPTSTSSSPTSRAASTTNAATTTNDAPTTMTNLLSTATTTGSDSLSIPTTQSVPTTQSTSSYTTFVTTTNSNGALETITAVLGAPTQKAKPSGFAHNNGAIAAVSILGALFGCGLLACVFFTSRRKSLRLFRRRTSRHDEEFAEMSFAPGIKNVGGDYYAGAQSGGGLSAEQRDNIPMRSPSMGSLHQTPMVPVDTMRESIIGHPYASGNNMAGVGRTKSLKRSEEGHANNQYGAGRANADYVATGGAGYDDYNAYNAAYDAQYQAQASVYDAYGQQHSGHTNAYAQEYHAQEYSIPAAAQPSHPAPRAQHNTGRNDWGTPYKAAQDPAVGNNEFLANDPFAHSQDGYAHATSTTALTEVTTPSAYYAPPRRSGSGRSRTGMTFGQPDRDEDDEYEDIVRDDYDVDEHGPTNDDDSVILGRASGGHLNARQHAF